jgi:hypothetical protein
MHWKVGKISQTCLAFERKGKFRGMVEWFTMPPCHGVRYGFESRYLGLVSSFLVTVGANREAPRQRPVQRFF